SVRIDSAMRRVASRARAPATLEVTSRKRWPFVRVCAPTRGSTCSAVSGESGARSASRTTPSFIWIRWATGGPLPGAGWGGIIARGVAGLGRRLVPPDRDAHLTDGRPARCPPERLGERFAVQDDLLADDRGVGLDDQRLALD